MGHDRLRLVVEGSIAISARKPSGKEVVISEVGPRGWAAWLPCFAAAPPNHDFYSGAKSCFLAVPVTVVHSLCLQYPALYPLIMGELGLRFRLRRVSNNIHQSTEAFALLDKRPFNVYLCEDVVVSHFFVSVHGIGLLVS